MKARQRMRVATVLAVGALLAGAASVHADNPSVRADDASVNAKTKAPARVDRPAAADHEAQAQSQAVLARLVPYVGLPGVTTSVGLVTAQVSAGFAQASAAAADFGLLGTLAAAGAESSAEDAGLAFELPAPISADSEGVNEVERDPFSAALPPSPGLPDADPAAGSSGADGSAPALLAHESARASKKPLSATGQVAGPTLQVPGLLSLRGGLATATTDERGAVSEVLLDRLDLGDGQVVISGLRWAADQSAQEAATSGFTVRGLTVAGQELPVSSPAELAESLTAANASLAPLGLVISLPTSTADAGGGSVAPLIVQVRNPEPLVEPSRQAAAALAPLVTQVVEAAIAANPDAAAAQLVANAVVGGAGGRSGGRLEIGGVTARSLLVEVDALADSVVGAFALPSAPAAATPLPTPSTVAPVPAGPVGALGAGVTPAATTAPVATGTQPSVLAQDAAGFGVPTEDAGSGLALLALGLGLAAILLLAAGDRIRMAAGG